MAGIVIGAVLGGLLFAWLFDLDKPEEIMRHEAGDVRSGKGRVGVWILILAYLALVLVELLPAMTIGGIPTK